MDQSFEMERNYELIVDLPRPYYLFSIGTYLYAAWTWIFYRKHWPCRRFSWYDTKAGCALTIERIVKSMRNEREGIEERPFLPDWRNHQIRLGQVEKGKHRWRGLLRCYFLHFSSLLFSSHLFSSLFRLYPSGSTVLINERFLRRSAEWKGYRRDFGIGHYIIRNRWNRSIKESEAFLTPV